MVEDESDRLDAVFASLADPTRRTLLQRLGDGPLSVGELAAPLAMSLAAASKHIQVLERAGLIRREVQGRVHLCRLDARPLHAGLEWIRHYQQFWERSLDALAEQLAAEDARKPAIPLKTRAARQRP